MSSYPFPAAAPPQAATSSTDPTAVMGRRIGAWVVDVLLFLLIIAFVGPTPLNPLAEYYDTNDVSNVDCTVIEQANDVSNCAQIGDRLYFTEGSDAAIGFVAVLAAFLLYSFVQGATGRTPGKAVFGVKVVDEQGGTPGFGKSILRTILWVVDLAPWCIPGLVGFVTGLTTKGHRRVGDMAAKTLVVGKGHTGPPQVPGLATAAGGAWPGSPGADTYGPYGQPGQPEQPWGAAPQGAGGPPTSWGSQPQAQPQPSGPWGAPPHGGPPVAGGPPIAGGAPAAGGPPPVGGPPSAPAAPSAPAGTPSGENRPAPPGDWTAPGTDASVSPAGDTPSTDAGTPTAGDTPAGDAGAGDAPPSDDTRVADSPTESTPRAAEAPASTDVTTPISGAQAPAAQPAASSPAAGQSAAAASSGYSPQWDAARGTYIVWEPNRGKWLGWDEAAQEWKPL